MVALLTALLMGACGGDDDEPESGPTTTVDAAGAAQACADDARALAVAEEALHAGTGRYATMAALVDAGFLAEPSTRHDIAVAPDGASYRITVADPACGEVGQPR